MKSKVRRIGQHYNKLMQVNINSTQVAGLIVQDIFKYYQPGLGSTEHPVIIDVTEKEELKNRIEKILKQENEI